MSNYKFRNINSIGRNIKHNEKCRLMFQELEKSPIPIIAKDLNLQVEIEQLAINYFVKGYKKAEKQYTQQISSLTYQRKVYLERIKGLEAMLKETNNGK